jgi:uncharacterized membrane protein
VRWFNLQKDKLKHAIAGVALSIVAGLFLCLVAGLIPWTWLQVVIAGVGAAGFGFLVAAVVGAAKEIIWDWLLKKGTPELLDFVATVLGGALGAVILHAAR